MCTSCEPNGHDANASPNSSNGANGHHANGASNPGGPERAEGRPAARISRPFTLPKDSFSNISRFKIIESTLREGEQFANAYFDTETKIQIALYLDEMGIDYLELTSPAASEQSRLDAVAICNLNLRAKVLTHIRCNMEDAKLAVETGVDGVDVVIGTSSFLQEHSHGKDMDWIKAEALRVIAFVKSKGLEIRFSSEDSFRSDLVDLLSLYSLVDRVGGVTRVGIADTVGGAHPRQVYELVRLIRGVLRPETELETHFHDDTGTAIANAYEALAAGATHVDTSILGIGERNGITPLGGFLARMIVADRDYVLSKYKLHMLKEIEDYVASKVEIKIPFNNPITGFCAFTHKAGIHAKAILANPSTYEILNPADFGLTRYIHFASRLTGWNAVRARAEQLGLKMSEQELKQCTAQIKAIADVKKITLDDTDTVINNFYKQRLSGGASDKPLLEGITAEEQRQLTEKVASMEIDGEAKSLLSGDAANGAGIADGKQAIEQLLQTPSNGANGTH